MKKILLFLTQFLFVNILMAQVPQFLNYQAVARDNNGNILDSRTLNVRFSIHDSTPTGTIVYSETNADSTNKFGLFTNEIGGGTVVTGNFASINWATGNKFLEVDINLGSGYVTMGTTELLSVPYALYAKSAGSVSGNGGNVGGNTYIILSGNITDAQAATMIQQQLGTATQFIWILNTTQLTTATFSGLTNAVEIKVSNNTSLQSLSFPDLVNVYNDINIDNTNSIQAISFPNLTTTYGSLLIYPKGINSLILSSLINVSGSFSFGDFGDSTSTITSLNLALLESAGDFVVGAPYLASLNLQDLKNVYNYDADGYFAVSGTALTSLSLPLLTNLQCDGFSASNNKLTSQAVNSLLHTLVSATLSNGRLSDGINLSGQTPPAPPTGQGLIDKQTLIGEGYSVTTD